MNGIIKYSLYVGVMLLTLCFCGCSDETPADNPKDGGALLNMYVNVEGASTRLAELGKVDNMFTEAGVKKYKNVGLYIYYQDDYDKGDLSKPYIRNLECKLENKKLTPVEPSAQQIYIYDRMTIVAFYPYNESVNDFANKTDEKAYPISESDYSQQLYIPYRAQTNVNPTNAYMIELEFKPQQTCKVEVVLVADSQDDFPQSASKTDGSIKLLPNVDRYNGGYNATQGDLRENWLDHIEYFPASSGDNTESATAPVGGKYARRYTAYVWKSGENDPHHDGEHKHHDNILKAGEQLFVSDKLILTVPHTVNLSEETVYRYGYNLTTGEIFIPTSDRLVYDAKSLQDVKFDEYRAYQVCDVDLDGEAWTPKTVFRGTYDGGGHKISNLSLTATPTQTGAEADKQAFGLFESITSESTLMNIDLVNPTITVDYSTTSLIDTCYVGALCGIVNPELSEAKKRKMILDGLPNVLSTPVKEALVKERMKNFAKTKCYIRGCKVTDPVITVKGENVRVGGLCGGAGNQKQKAEIKDSYVWQSPGNNGTYSGIIVNGENKTDYQAAYAGAFCGMMTNGSIANCYSNLEKIEAYIKKEATGNEEEGTGLTSEDVAQGFCTLAPAEEKGEVTVIGCYTSKTDNSDGVTNFTNGWPTSWPLFKDDTTVSNGGTGKVNYPGSYPAYKWTDSWYDMGASGSAYPTLVWEHPLIIPLQ